MLPTSALYQEPTALKRGDAVLVLAWNFAPSILKQHAELERRGVEFIVPMPLPAGTGAGRAA